MIEPRTFEFDVEGGHFTVVVDVTETQWGQSVGGNINTTGLRVGCPSCGTDACYCAGNQGESAALSRAEHDAAIDGIEALVLAHACAGMDIMAPEYYAGLVVALDTVGNEYQSFLDDQDDDEDEDEKSEKE